MSSDFYDERRKVETTPTIFLDSNSHASMDFFIPGENWCIIPIELSSDFLYFSGDTNVFHVERSNSEMLARDKSFIETCKSERIALLKKLMFHYLDAKIYAYRKFSPQPIDRLEQVIDYTKNEIKAHPESFLLKCDMIGRIDSLFENRKHKINNENSACHDVNTESKVKLAITKHIQEGKLTVNQICA